MPTLNWNREQIHFWLKLAIPVAVLTAIFWAWGSIILRVLSPFLIAFLLAYVFNPVVTFLEGRKRTRFCMHRILAVSILYVGFLLLSLVFCLILARILVELVLFAERIPEYGASLYRLLERYFLGQMERLPQEFKIWVGEQMSPDNLRQLFFEHIKPRLEEANLAGGVGTALRGFSDFMQIAFGLLLAFAASILGGAGAFISFVTALILTLVITFYLLIDFDRLGSFMTGLIPQEYRSRTLKILHRMDLQLSGFLRGQILVCVCVGGLISLGLSLVGVDYALLIGLAAGAFNIIPYLGPVMGAVPAVVLTLLESYRIAMAQETSLDWGRMAIRLGLVTLVFVVVQSLDGFFISPRIMGNKLDLHPMIILLALLMGGALFGLVGMLVAVPIACMVRVLIEEIYLPDRHQTDV